MAGVYGEITSGDVLKASIAKEVMWKDSDLMAIGTQILPPTPWPNLDAQWAFPLEVDGEYPVPEGAIASRKRVEWVHFGAVMEMAEFRWMITDHAKARQLENYTMSTMMKRGAEYFAEKEDQQILDALYAGAGATAVTVGAGNEWDTNAATRDIEGDIMDAVGYVVDESNIRLNEIRNMCIVYPAKVYSRLNELSMINNITQSLQKYMESSHGLSFYPTRYYHETSSTGIEDDALVIVKGEKTGIHGYYSGSDIPLSEVERVFGRGMDYLTKKLFFSKIVPEDEDTTTSYRICKISNVI